jgi:diaminohydroxyphosphoribosylaminopyrimidine deaminase/5-amino-6-(5-phosphoribosylamino)uracil reductase
LAAALLRERAVDRLRCFLAPLLIGGDGRPMLEGLGVRGLGDVLRCPDLQVERVGHDILLSAKL